MMKSPIFCPAWKWIGRGRGPTTLLISDRMCETLQSRIDHKIWLDFDVKAIAQREKTW